MYKTSFSPKVIRPFHLDKDVLDYVLTETIPESGILLEKAPTSSDF